MGTGPLIYEVQTRCWLNELAGSGSGLTLDKVPLSVLKTIKDTGAEWLWLMGVWQTGDIGRKIAREHPDLQASYHQALSDFTADDVAGSPYSIQDYHVSDDFGGDGALAVFRENLQRCGLKLLLDFVPNHVALDNGWVKSHPEYFIEGVATDVEKGNGVELGTSYGRRVLLHGRDPYFPPWTDTLQLNWSSPDLLDRLETLLLDLAGKCDGLRCDMAMLLLKKVFSQTWGKLIPTMEEPWKLLISAVKRQFPAFVFVAEAYWDLEWDLTCQGFDFVYDKRLYDRICQGDAPAVNGHLRMDWAFHQKQLHFLENHDEPRVAQRLRWLEQRPALALVSSLPGGWLFHHHQQHGAKIKLPVQLCRYAREEENHEISSFYKLILEERKRIPATAEWQLLSAFSAWENNDSNNNLVACCWTVSGRPYSIIVVNMASYTSQCYLDVANLTLPESLTLEDKMTGVAYCRQAGELYAKGLFIELPAYGIHYFIIV